MRIDVPKKNVSLVADEEDGRCGQRPLARVLEDNPHFPHEDEVGITEKGDDQIVFLRCFGECRGIFSADGAP